MKQLVRHKNTKLNVSSIFIQFYGSDKLDVKTRIAKDSVAYPRDLAALSIRLLVELLLGYIL